jgi:hypothetical protein
MHTPQYVDVSDIPMQIPDDYTDAQKFDALEVAEAAAELDLNDGGSLNDIPPNLMSKVRTAIKQKATAELAESAEDPDDVTLGDLSDDGTTKQDYADQYHEQYESLISKIRNSDVLKDTQDDSAYVYNTHSGDY